jgi:glutamate decarboxylase
MRKGSFDLGKRALEGSRPGMALFLHAGLHLIGLKGYEFLIDAGIEKTQYMAARISAMPEFELLSEPDINLLLYRYIPQS